MGLSAERWYPVLLGALSCLAWWYNDLGFPKAAENLLAAAISLGAILAGFLATAKTVLIALRGTEVMKDLHRSAYIKDFVSYLAWGLWGAFGFAVWSLVGFFASTASKYFQLPWVFLAVFSSAAFFRVTYILIRILDHTSKE
jgi:hypothetical protein